MTLSHTMSRRGEMVVEETITEVCGGISATGGLDPIITEDLFMVGHDVK